MSGGVWVEKIKEKFQGLFSSQGSDCYSLRCKEMLRQMAKHKVSRYFIEDPIDLFYYTGKHFSRGILIFSKDEIPCLALDSRYYEGAKNLSHVFLQKYDRGFWKHYFSNIKGETLTFNKERMVYSKYEKLEEEAAEYKVSLLAGKDLCSVQQEVKDEHELHLIRMAAKLGSQGYDFICAHLSPGMSEREIAKMVEIFWIENGADGLGFEPVIAFGANSALPHHRPSDQRLDENDIVLIDIGVNLNSYHSDMTRTFFIGTPDSKLKEIWGVVKEASEAALKLCRPGVKLKTLDEAARSVIIKAGYGDHFTHSLGHGIGLRVHEGPHFFSGETELLAGHVITIEPGIYLSGIGGVRLEDTVIITSEGYEDITQREKKCEGRKFL